MKVSNGIIIASHGTLIRPQLHDAHLIGIPSDSRMLILARDVEGAVQCIELTGIERFRAKDLREGNIILDLSLEAGASVRPEDVAYPYGPTRGSGTEDLPSGIMERFKSGELALIRLDPSFWVLVRMHTVCTGIKVVPNGASDISTLI